MRKKKSESGSMWEVGEREERRGLGSRGWFFCGVGWCGGGDEKKPDENGGTKINPERRLPTETLRVEIC